MMNKELKPCPFCGGLYNKQTDTVYHADDCALSWVRQCDLMSISDEAWNTRDTSYRDRVVEAVSRCIDDKVYDFGDDYIAKGVVSMAIEAIKEVKP